MALLNLFSGGALSYVSVFSLGIMPDSTSSLIMQMLQSVVPSLHELAREGEVGQTKITQYSRYLTLALALLNAVGYLFLFKSFGISVPGAGAPGLACPALLWYNSVCRDCRQSGKGAGHEHSDFRKEQVL